jgi:hypothetical protein
MDVLISRIGPHQFKRPVRLTKSGLYVTGRNEDGESILTRAQSEEEFDG